MKSLGTTLLAVMLSPTVLLAQPPNQFADSLSFTQWVEVSPDQDLIGRLITLGDEGEIKAAGAARIVMTRFDQQSFRGTTDELGRFTMEKIEPGYYALSAVGEEFCFSAPIHVIPSTMPTADALPVTLELPVTPISLAAFIEPLQRYLPIDPLMPQQDFTKVDLPALHPSIEDNFRYVITQVDGGLSGRVFAAGANGDELPEPGVMNVILFYGISTIGPVQTDSQGTFYIADVPPDNYGILAVGRSGVAIAGLRVVEPVLTPVEPTDGATVRSGAGGRSLVALQSGVSDTFQMQTSPPQLAARSLEEADPTSDAPTAPAPPLGPIGPPVAGISGAGSAGGGGGGGGGDLGGGAAGLAALAAIAAVAADSDDGDGGTLAPTPGAASFVGGGDSDSQ